MSVYRAKHSSLGFTWAQLSNTPNCGAAEGWSPRNGGRRQGCPAPKLKSPGRRAAIPGLRPRPRCEKTRGAPIRRRSPGPVLAGRKAQLPLTHEAWAQCAVIFRPEAWTRELPPPLTESISSDIVFTA